MNENKKCVIHVTTKSVKITIFILSRLNQILHYKNRFFYIRELFHKKIPSPFSERYL